VSGGAAEDGIYGDAPLLKEPFGDVDSVPVLLAPDVEFTRRSIHLCREFQSHDLQLEFSGQRGSTWNGSPPIGVAAFARVDNGCRHRSRSYSARGNPQENLRTGERGLRNPEVR